MAHGEEGKSFKVVDKRGMTEEEGGCCGGHHHHDDDEMDMSDDAASHGERPEMSFSLFVQSLAHQAMMGLGIAPWPDSGLVKQELMLAKETIDVIAILKDKSKGNLTGDEQAMIDSMLYQLQVAYVEISKAPAGNNSPIIK